MHDFYGAEQGVRIARKHVKAYLQRLGVGPAEIREFNANETPSGQRDWIAAFRDDGPRLRAA